MSHPKPPIPDAEARFLPGTLCSFAEKIFNYKNWQVEPNLEAREIVQTLALHSGAGHFGRKVSP
jgi:hypothetical protein